MIVALKMLEPTTASLALYLFTKTTKIKPNIVKRNPFHYKRRICKWVYKNKHTIMEVGLDEIADVIFDLSNNLHIHSHLPTISMVIYIMILVIFIIA
jgi:hypothetical protein